MRFALAIVAFLIGVGLGGYGIAQTTVLNGPSELTATSESDSEAPVTVIGGETLNALDGRQDLRISGSDTIFAAYARTEDILAWVGDASYNSIGFDAAANSGPTRSSTRDAVRSHRFACMICCTLIMACTPPRSSRASGSMPSVCISLRSTSSRPGVTCTKQACGASRRKRFTRRARALSEMGVSGLGSVGFGALPWGTLRGIVSG